jgi:perosamine synthetase
MTRKDLAMNGGTRAVRGEYRERWRQVRISDIWPIFTAVRRDINTLAKGEGAIAEFEKKFAQLVDTKYALAMNSGTASLHSAYFAAGVKPGTEVIVPGYTFFATAAPILQCGGRPVFCDVNPDTLLADPDDVERRITPRTRAICVVHLWGNPAPMDRFADIARRHNLALIEDCSHAHGALFQGRPVGSWGHIGCFSLQGPKAVSAGEGGIAVTNDPVLFDRMLALGHYGRMKDGQAKKTFDTDFLTLGAKYRPHLYGIYLALGSLSRLKELNRLRQRNYDILCSELADCEAIQPVKTTPEATRGGFLEFIVRYTPEKAGNWSVSQFIEAAKAEGVPVSKERYARLGKRKRMLSETPIFSTLDGSTLGGFLPTSPDFQPNPDDLPVVSTLSQRLMTLPAFAKVSEQYVRDCAAALKKVVACAANSESETTAAAA